MPASRTNFGRRAFHCLAIEFRIPGADRPEVDWKECAVEGHVAVRALFRQQQRNSKSGSLDGKLLDQVGHACALRRANAGAESGARPWIGPEQSI